MDNMSYWLDSNAANFPALKNDIRADVAVIGAGIAGASVSYWIGNDCKVVLLEEERIASKASGRNAGFLLTGTSDYYSIAVERYGHAKAKTIWKLTQQNHDLLEKHILKNGIECEHKRSGSYLLGMRENEMSIIRKSVAMLRRDGFNYKIMNGKEINELLSVDGFHGAAYNSKDGEINPVKLVRGLVKVANENGTDVFENTSIQKIVRRDDIFELRTKHATVKADYIVLATNAYTPLLHPTFRNIIRPVRGQILGTKPCRRLFRGVFYANYGYEYWRQLPDGSVLAGGFRETDPAREVGYSMIATRKIQNKLEGLLTKLHVKSSIEYRWSGIMGFSKDHLPLVGPFPSMKNLLICAGYSGHGLGFSFIAGKMISEMILNGRPYGIFSPTRFFD